MAPSIRVTPEGYQGLKKLIDAGYANTMSGVIERFVKEEGVGSEKSDEKIFVKPRASDIDEGNRMGFVSAEDRESNFSDVEEEDVINMLGEAVCHYRYQREAMRAVFQKANGDKFKTIRAYEYLEEKSFVQRKNNTHGFDAGYYAEALYNDGIQKGWLTISQEAVEFIKQEAERLGIKRFDEDVQEK